MTHLTRAHEQLFRRTADETFSEFDELLMHCRHQREQSIDRWQRVDEVDVTRELTLKVGDNTRLTLNDWSFSQLCRMAGVSKDTINRLSPATASRALVETLPHAENPLQFLTTGNLVRSVHGVAYTRLWNCDLLDLVNDYASDFQPPQQAAVGEGGSGLYCGEQDMFCFLIDPTGWAEIEGQAFAPGFFLWNSEVGRRSVGIQTFWFQSVCQNHIVWDAVEVVEFKRKHTAGVRQSLDEIRAIIENLVRRRDERRDGFMSVVRKAMTERLGDDADEVLKTVASHGIPRGLAKKAVEVACEHGRLSIFAVVDALTQLTQQMKFVGDRTELDQKTSSLLMLAA